MASRPPCYARLRARSDRSRATLCRSRPGRYRYLLSGLGGPASLVLAGGGRPAAREKGVAALLNLLYPGARSPAHIGTHRLVPRQIRQSVIAKWLKTQDVRKVQYLAGHRRIIATERYLAHHLEDLQESLKLYHPLG